MRMVRDYIEVEDHISLDDMIEKLAAVRAALPAGSENIQVVTSGCDVFGRKLSISFFRPQTEEEIARDARYAPRHDLDIAA